MSPRVKKLYTFPIDPDLARAIKAVKVLDGISEAEQIREGLRLWLRKRGSPRPAGHGWGYVADRLERQVEARGAQTASRRAGTRREA
jgi:hypothetical protein